MSDLYQGFGLMLQLKGGVTHASPFYFASIADFFDDLFFLVLCIPCPFAPCGLLSMHMSLFRLRGATQEKTNDTLSNIITKDRAEVQFDEKFGRLRRTVLPTWHQANPHSCCSHQVHLSSFFLGIIGLPKTSVCLFTSAPYAMLTIYVTNGHLIS